jgi:phenylacetate-coenzyme A ligase PaaK-like adenylate-forming protein
MPLWESLQFVTLAARMNRAGRLHWAEIARVQRERLVELVQHARDRSAFYRERFAGIDAVDFRLVDLPVSSKRELMEHFDDVVTVDDVRRADVEAFLSASANLGTYFRDTYVLSHTSGSQGQPLLVVQPKENLELLFALQAARGNTHALGIGEVWRRLQAPARLAAVTLKRGFYPSAIAFAYLPPGARRYIESQQFSMGDENLIERLREFRPTHLTAYASVLHELAREIETGRLRLAPDLQQVVNISERLTAKARKHYEQVFGSPVLDDYAMGECLFLSNGCPASGGMHVNADWAILEVVDENNQPVTEGTRGARVLLTNLANRVQPIIRYEIGDIVTMATKPCGCGSPLPLIKRVEGRDSDVFWLETADGVQPLSPALFELALSQVLDAREFQLIQETGREFRVLIEPLPGAELDESQARQLIDEQLRDHGLAGQLDVQIEAVDRLAPEAGTKFKRIVSKVAPPRRNLR